MENLWGLLVPDPLTMCFVLYVAARSKPSLIGFRPEAPALNTQELDEYTKPVKDKFTLLHVTYVGSDQGCGCGFRYVPFGQDFEGCELIYSEGVETQNRTQHNHQQLRDYLLQEFKGESFVELYGCWSGEENEAASSNGEIPLDRLAEPTFSLRERGLYRIILNERKT
jgi:hypothetical protein